MIILILRVLEGGPLDCQLGVVADALCLGVVVVVTGAVLSPAHRGEEPRPQPWLSPHLAPGGRVAGAGAHREAVPLQRVHVQALRPAVSSDHLLVQGDDVGAHLVQLVLALLLLLQADRHELQHQQVDGRGHCGQAPEQEAEADVIIFLLNTQCEDDLTSPQHIQV